MNKPMQPQPDIRGVLIQVAGARLLLPNATIAEVLSFADPEPIADAPDWLLGRIRWRGWQLPLVAFSRLAGIADEKGGLGSKVIVLKALGGDPKAPFFAVAVFARGLLDHLFTRAYLPPRDDSELSGRALETDPVLALRALQLANSAFFGVARRITSVHDAIHRLGVNLVRTLVLRCHVFETLAPKSPAFSHDHFHSYSLRVAKLARSFAPRDKESAFSAGLLLDIGRLVIGVVLPDLFARIDEEMRATERTAQEVERSVLGTTHAEIGAYLLDRWRLPFSVVETVAYHHQPRRSCSRDRTVLACVHAADALVGILTCNEPEDCLDRELIADAGMAANLPAWRELARDA